MIFTDSWLKSLKYSAKRIEYRSDGNPGFVMAIRGKTKTWLYIFTFMGRKSVMTLGTYPDMSLAKAKAAYSAAASLRGDGINPADVAKEGKRAEKQAVLDSRKEFTVTMLVDDYLTNYAMKKKRSWREDERVLKKDIIPVIGQYKIKTITRRDVKAIVKKFQRQDKNAMARIVLAVTRKMFAYAIAEDIDAIESNPCSGIKVESSKTRERALSAIEIKLLWYGLDATTMNDSSRRLIRLNFLTGSRHSELRGLRWDEIQDDMAIIPASRMKGMESKVKAHNIPLTKTAIEIIGKPNGSEFVFPSPATGKPLHETSTRHALQRVLPDIKLEEFPGVVLSNIRIHDIRSSVNDWMAKLGISQFDRDRVLAHVDGSVNAKNYTVYEFDREKRQALEKWERKLKEILGMESAGNVVNLR